MTPKLNEKQELFCQYVANGMDAVTAYNEAGYTIGSSSADIEYINKKVAVKPHLAVRILQLGERLGRMPVDIDVFPSWPKRIIGDLRWAGVDLGVRSTNALKNLGCKTVEDISYLTENDLMRAPNCGKKSVREIKIFLENNGLPRLGEGVSIGPSRHHLVDSSVIDRLQGMIKEYRRDLKETKGLVAVQESEIATMRQQLLYWRGRAEFAPVVEGESSDD